MIFQVWVLIPQIPSAVRSGVSLAQVLNTGLWGGDVSIMRIFCLLNFYKVILVGDLALELRK